MRQLCVVLLALTLLAAPAGASAAGFGQVQPLTLRGDEECVRATGAPGQLAIPATGGIRFVDATRDGLRLGETVKLVDGFDCAATSVRPSGAGVIAGERGFDAPGVVAAVRDPGGAWGPPVTWAPEGDWRPQQVMAAVSDRGDVIVAWREQRGSSDKEEYRFLAARRAPGGAFGAVEQIGATTARLELSIPAIAATGEAFLLMTSVEGSRAPYRVPVTVAIAPPGAPFGAPAFIANVAWRSMPALAAAPDGRALVAIPDGKSLLVAERAPGAAFAPGVAIGAADPTIAAASVQVGAGGEAAVAWARPYTGDFQIASRPGPGSFAAPAIVKTGSLLPAGYDPFFISETFFATFLGVGGLIYGGEEFGQVALTGDGRAAAAWYLSPSGEPGLVTVPLAGGAATTQRAPEPLREPGTARPVILADGTPALAWTEDREDSTNVFRLHLGADGIVQRPDPPGPRVTVGAPRSRTLRMREPLRLPVRCDGPCEVHAEISFGAGDLSDTLRLTRAGRGTLSLDGAAFAASTRLGPVRVRLTYRAPDALVARVRTLTVRIVRDRTVPDPRIRNLKAERQGDRVRVTWRVTGRLLDDGSYFVTGSATRNLAEEPAEVRFVEGGNRQRSFTVTLRADERVRFVAVRGGTSALESRPPMVPVR